MTDAEIEKALDNIEASASHIPAQYRDTALRNQKRALLYQEQQKLRDAHYPDGVPMPLQYKADSGGTRYGVYGNQWYRPFNVDDWYKEHNITTDVKGFRRGDKVFGIPAEGGWHTPILQQEIFDLGYELIDADKPNWVLRKRKQTKPVPSHIIDAIKPSPVIESPIKPSPVIESPIKPATSNRHVPNEMRYGSQIDKRKF